MMYRIQGSGGDLFWEGWARNREDAMRRAIECNEGDENAIGLIKQCEPYPMVDHTIPSKHEEFRDNLD